MSKQFIDIYLDNGRERIKKQDIKSLFFPKEGKGKLLTYNGDKYTLSIKKLMAIQEELENDEKEENNEEA